jgi:hypothetical protein
MNDESKTMENMLCALARRSAFSLFFLYALCPSRRSGCLAKPDAFVARPRLATRAIKNASRQDKKALSTPPNALISLTKAAKNCEKLHENAQKRTGLFDVISCYQRS